MLENVAKSKENQSQSKIPIQFKLASSDGSARGSRSITPISAGSGTPGGSRGRSMDPGRSSMDLERRPSVKRRADDNSQINCPGKGIIVLTDGQRSALSLTGQSTQALLKGIADKMVEQQTEFTQSVKKIRQETQQQQLTLQG